MNYRLISLFALVTAIAVICGIATRPSRLEEELRADLKLGFEEQLVILDASQAGRVIAVSMQSGRAKLFAAVKEYPERSRPWRIPVVVGSGAPNGVPEQQIEYSREFDHFPTAAEIRAFRNELGLDP